MMNRTSAASEKHDHQARFCSFSLSIKLAMSIVARMMNGRLAK